ncbi:MAG: DUF2179 domain-containing protein [Bacilli bacterium]|nr:DUF2179 domain-containing protein [Bacilli bacterium]
MFLLCIKIFFIRILDVSLGTVRTLVTVRGKNFIASIIGFVEVLVWFLVAKEAISEANDSIWIAISYALGFAAGTFIGGIVSRRIIKTNLTIEIISSKADKLVKTLRDSNFAVTVLDIKGRVKSTSKMLILEIESHRLSEIREITNEVDNKAFVIVNETKYVFNGYIGN